MSGFLYQLYNDGLAYHQKCVFEAAYVITGAKAGKWILPQPSAIIGYDSTDFTQSAIDALLGTVNEFIAGTAFGSTALGTDALGLVLSLSEGATNNTTAIGQAAVSPECFLEVIPALAGTAADTIVVKGQTSALPNTLAAPARMQIGAYGNVAVQFVYSGLDAATSGMVLFRFHLQMK